MSNNNLINLIPISNQSDRRHPKQEIQTISPYRSKTLTCTGNGSPAGVPKIPRRNLKQATHIITKYFNFETGQNT
jgi:hypothetical protein